MSPQSSCRHRTHHNSASRDLSARSNKVCEFTFLLLPSLTTAAAVELPGNSKALDLLLLRGILFMEKSRPALPSQSSAKLADLCKLVGKSQRGRKSFFFFGWVLSINWPFSGLFGGWSVVRLKICIIFHNDENYLVIKSIYFLKKH